MTEPDVDTIIDELVNGAKEWSTEWSENHPHYRPLDPWGRLSLQDPGLQRVPRLDIQASMYMRSAQMWPLTYGPGYSWSYASICEPRGWHDKWNDLMNSYAKFFDPEILASFEKLLVAMYSGRPKSDLLRRYRNKRRIR